MKVSNSYWKELVLESVTERFSQHTSHGVVLNDTSPRPNNERPTISYCTGYLPMLMTFCPCVHPLEQVKGQPGHNQDIHGENTTRNQPQLKNQRKVDSTGIKQNQNIHTGTHTCTLRWTASVTFLLMVGMRTFVNIPSSEVVIHC